jgi:hypothetical protein
MNTLGKMTYGLINKMRKIIERDPRLRVQDT